MNDRQPVSLLEHFTRQFAEQASRGGDCAGPLAAVAAAGHEVRRLQHELAHEQALAARADERVSQAEKRVADADAEISHWEQLAARDEAEEQRARTAALETETWVANATKQLGVAEAAYQVCRSRPGGHEKGACSGESAQVKHWRSVIAGYQEAIEDFWKQVRFLQRRRAQEMRAAEAAKQDLAKAQAKEQQAESERDDLAQQVAATEQALSAAKQALAQAHAALRKCRKNHPAEDCGDRGGPGVRLYGRGAEKKCASWKDVLGTAQ
jgi:hypothetical protein